MEGDQNATSIESLLQDRPMPANTKQSGLPDVTVPEYNDLKNMAYATPQTAHVDDQAITQEQGQPEYQVPYYEEVGFWAHNKFGILVGLILFLVMFMVVPKLLTYSPRIFTGTESKFYVATVTACLGVCAFQTFAPYI